MDSQVTDLPVVVRTPHQEVIVTGAGRLLTEAYSAGGRFIAKKANRLAHKWGHRPYAAKERILKQLKTHEGSATKPVQFRNEVQVGGGKLEKACMAFLKYALPSESRAAQLKTFKCIVHLATHFPGLRHVFLRCIKHIQAAGATKTCTVKLWMGDDDSNHAPDKTKWRFFLDTLDDLGYSPVGTGEYSVIEQSLVASRSCDKFEPWVAIRYLGGILETPSFWHQECHYNHKAVTEMLFGRVRQLVEDMDMEGWAKMDNTLRLRVFLGDVQGIDELVAVLLNGVGVWCQNDENHRLDPVRNNFTRLMELVCHPAARHLLPRSHNHASQEYTLLVGMTYQRDSVEIVELSNRFMITKTQVCIFAKLLCTRSPPSSPASATHSLDSQHPPTASVDSVTAPGTKSHIPADPTEGEVDEDDRNGMAWMQETREKAVREKEVAFKPVFLKGLFSVATTSTKSPAAIKTNIRRVLDRMQVQHRETKTGFECIHMPLIDLSSIDSPAVRQYAQQGHQMSKPKALPPIPLKSGGRAPSPLPSTRSLSPLPMGQVDMDVFESTGNTTLSVRFDINIVKVPILALHGIQFRRASGDGWMYQMLARRVLTELKL